MIQKIKNHIAKRNQFIDIRRIRPSTHYTPKANKFKQGALFGFIGLCLITPMTNGLLIPLNSLLNKFPLWVYK